MDRVSDIPAIVAFLAARYDEAERTAKALLSATVIIGTSPDFYGSGGPAADSYWRRFTPAYMLDDIAAKRKILAEYERVSADIASGALPEWEQDGSDSLKLLYERRRKGYLDGLEIALMFHAAPFARHPDFDPAWNAS